MRSSSSSSGACVSGSPSADSSLELTDEAKEVVAEAGWDPTYGARPLKRAMQRLVENPLAMRLLEGDFARGRHGARRRPQNGELVFEKAAAVAAAAWRATARRRGGSRRPPARAGRRR